MHVRREDLRKRLEELTDDELLERCARDITEARMWRDDRTIQDLANESFFETRRRGRPGIWDRALEEAARRRAEIAEQDRRAIDRFNERFKKKEDQSP